MNLWEDSYYYTLLLGMQTGTTHLERNLATLERTINVLTFQHSILASRFAIAKYWFIVNSIMPMLIS